jgi:hypothetical protein
MHFAIPVLLYGATGALGCELPPAVRVAEADAASTLRAMMAPS